MAYELGLGGDIDKEKAIEYYNISIQKEDPRGYFKLAMIAQENNEEENYYNLMKQAAELGLLEAQHNLACYYVEKNDITKAAGWFLNSARCGFFPSMVNIGTIFLKGKGDIGSDPVAAYIWFKEAQKIEDSAKLQELISEAKEEINNL